jgi:hypothetical protein
VQAAHKCGFIVHPRIIGMPNPNDEKGRALERAMQFVQENLFKSDPRLAGTNFTIEVRKTVNVAGVRHEIDVLVTTHPGTQHESISIFECKNWKAPVGKNEVIIFADKVAAIRANRGFLVAKSLSKDAQERLKQDSRLIFLRCTEDFFSPLNNLEVVHSVHDPYGRKVAVKYRDLSRDHPDVLDYTKVKCLWNGKLVDFLSYVDQLTEELVSDDHKRNKGRYSQGGTHPGHNSVRINYEPGEFVLDDSDIEHLILSMWFTVTVRRRTIFCKFELDGQARVYSFREMEDGVIGTLPQIDILESIKTTAT